MRRSYSVRPCVGCGRPHLLPRSSKKQCRACTAKREAARAAKPKKRNPLCMRCGDREVPSPHGKYCHTCLAVSKEGSAWRARRGKSGAPSPSAPILARLRIDPCCGCGLPHVQLAFCGRPKVRCEPCRAVECERLQRRSAEQKRERRAEAAKVRRAAQEAARAKREAEKEARRIERERARAEAKAAREAARVKREAERARLDPVLAERRRKRAARELLEEIRESHVDRGMLLADLRDLRRRVQAMRAEWRGERVAEAPREAERYGWDRGGAGWNYPG